MTYWLSEPFETLLARMQRDTGELQHPEGSELRPFATVIVGSGYGAALAALALTEGKGAEDGASIHVLERGREYVPGEFPKTIGDLPGYISVLSDQALFNQAPRTGNNDALWQIRMGNGVSAVIGSGLGGTSLINANVVLAPDPRVFDDWPEPTIHTPYTDKTWNASLRTSFDYVSKLLGANEHPQVQNLDKYAALQRTAKSLNLHCKPAPIAVSFRSGPNAVGVEQKQCTDCGNCVSGCNVGAKNTLAVNAWPLARSRGVNLHTGVEVRRLHLIEKPANESGTPVWAVECRSTRAGGAVATLYARRVILAAGTFGSTEVLRRSQYANSPLRTSRLLGQKFSTNGDVLAFSYGQNAPVRAAAHSPSLRTDDTLSSPRVGPTIAGCARPHSTKGSKSGNARLGTLEDGAIPYPIVRIWGEMLNTQSLLRRYGRCGVDQWTRQHPRHDPLAVARAALDHHQVMLVMGDDDALGWLTLAEPEGTLLPSWPDNERVPKAQRYFRLVDKSLQRSEQDNGFDGGHYFANAAWRAFPEEMQGVAEGAQAAEQLLTVHPLGGCCMGESAESGVVNTRGQVFCDHQGTAVYPGLYVLDGSIIPGAIGTNPLLTIAAVAHHLASAIRNHGRIENIDTSSTTQADSVNKVDAALRNWPVVDGYHLAQPRDESVTAVYSERLFLSLQDKNVDAQALKTALGLNANDARGLSLDVQWRFDDILNWLENPERALPATATMSYQAVTPTVTVPTSDQQPFLRLKGHVRLGGIEEPQFLQRCWRVVLALWRFWKLRGDEITRGSTNLFTALKSLPGYLRVANVHASHRYIAYILSREDGSLTLRGGKQLAYSMRCTEAGKGAEPLSTLNPWNALTRMPFSIQSTRGTYAPAIRPTFKVDMVRLTENVLPLQIERTPNTPTSILATGCLSAYFLRVLLQTHFWSFGAPDYKFFARTADKNIPRLQPPPAFISYRDRNAVVHAAPLAEPITHHINGSLCRLLRYTPPNDGAPARSVLLIHGLAHGSRVFWTDTIETNYVQYFLGQGYDVWLLDYRISANLNAKVPADISIDDISRADIPWAVKTVFERINRDYGDERDGPRRVHIFAHCVGAAVFAASTLQGQLEYRYEIDGPLLGAQRWRNYRAGMVASATLHAFQPWVKAGVSNRWHANALALFKDNINAEFLDPLPDRDPCFTQILIDRFANSLPKSTKEEPDNEHPIHALGNTQGGAISCNRMNLIYGYEWVHANLSDSTHTSLDTLLGPAPVALLRQAMKCVQHGRLTDTDGYSIYMRAENFERWWQFPTLFLHGDRNEVFDCASTVLSASNLAKIRRQTKAPNSSIINASLKTSDKIERDCYETNAFAHIQPGYGHMDALFGMRAHIDICPVINRFIRGESPSHDPKLNSQLLRSKFAELHDVPIHLATGPIISRPEYRNGERYLRVWANSEEFSNEPPRTLWITPVSANVSPKDTTNTSALTIKWDRTPWHSEARRNQQQTVSSPSAAIGSTGSDPSNPGFWLGTVNVENLNAPLRLTLEYGQRSKANIDACQQLQWHNRQWFKRAFDRRHTNPQHALSFIAGSCLYPGIPPEKQRSDQIFQAMMQHVEGDFGIDHVLLLGDQIYADASAGMIDPRSSYERYRARYRRAFGEPSSEQHSHAQKLLASVPTYFAIDDHEITNDWCGCHRDDEVQTTALHVARREWLNFQMHYPGVDPESKDLNCTRAWYSFTSAGFPFFVFDTRSERQLLDRWNARALLSEQQWQGFEQWLDDIAPDTPIVFIASGSPLGPVSNDILRYPELAYFEDTLLGHPGFLAEIGTILARKQLRRIVWLSGDPHFSTMGEVYLRTVDAEVHLQHICASGLFAPVPFVNARPDSYSWDRPVKLEYRSPRNQTSGLVIEAQHRHPVTAQSHFLRIDVQSGSVMLDVRAFDETGSEVPWPGRAAEWNTTVN